MTGLPTKLDEFFAAHNAHDADATLLYFAPGATVGDEGENIAGHAAIRSWLERTSAKYSAAVEPLDYRTENGRTVVVARVSGNFPGSPVNLAFRFALDDGGLIKSLEIGP
ncbi:MAG TPA: nuclear transport factor 2 family protein [Thermodesulfobacteriota bacterium]|nr:nuclear transport factor 2 family protein [Thermodesulfobacteriota bacterium]